MAKHWTSQDPALGPGRMARQARHHVPSREDFGTWVTAIGVFTVVGLSGCSEGFIGQGALGAHANADEPRFSLVATGVNGYYRLLQENFSVEGAASMSDRNEDYVPNTKTVAVAVPSEGAKIPLLDGWHIEHSQPNRPWSSIKAFLISDNPLSGAITANKGIEFVDEFNSDRARVTVTGDELDIGINATEIDPASLPEPDREFSVEKIDFRSVRPTDANYPMGMGAIGIDPWDNIYVAFNVKRNPDDLDVLRYNAVTGETAYLGSVRQTLIEAGNWQDGEPIPKGHTHIVYQNGKMYFGTQGFHGLNDYDPGVRGSHVIAIDCATGKLEDLSAFQPGGVFNKSEGLLAMWGLPELDIVVGQTTPSGDLVLYNTKTGNTKHVSGIQQHLGSHNGRGIVTTPNGNMFWSYGRDVHSIYRYNIASDSTTKIGFNTRDGFWNGQVDNRDRTLGYVTSSQGTLYQVDLRTKVWSRLGAFTPADVTVWGITLSRDETKLYAITFGPNFGANLATYKFYEFDIASGQTRTVDMTSFFQAHPSTGWSGQSHGYITGSAVTDTLGRIFFLYNYGKDGVLLQVDPGR
ncbi:MAG: hypothetical protein AB4040_07205 [Synechococcus sp.]